MCYILRECETTFMTNSGHSQISDSIGYGLYDRRRRFRNEDPRVNQSLVIVDLSVLLSKFSPSADFKDGIEQ